MDEKLQKLLDSSPSDRTLSGLSGSSLAYALVDLFRRRSQPLLVFVPHLKAAAELEEDRKSVV